MSRRRAVDPASTSPSPALAPTLVADAPGAEAPAAPAAAARHAAVRLLAASDPTVPDPAVDRAAVAVLLAGERAHAADLARAQRASATERAYAFDWADFTTWCAARQLPALPASPDTVTAYLAHLASGLDARRASTIQRRLAALAHKHRAAGHPTPTRDPMVRDTLAGIRRALGTAPAQKAPILTDTLRTMLAALPADLAGARDRALLLVGFAGAFRRAELVSLHVADVQLRREGLVVTLRRSKTDQTGQGRPVALPRGTDPTACPVRAYQAWLAAAGIVSGPIFRSLKRNGEVGERALHPDTVARIVKAAARRIGLDEGEVARLAGHSLRAGLATAAAVGGASERAIMRQTGHKSREMVDRYVRDGTLFRDNAATQAGL